MKENDTHKTGPWEYSLTVKVGHDIVGRPVLACESWPPTPSEEGMIRQMRDMLSAWLDNKAKIEER